jgi:hypothetical protein
MSVALRIGPCTFISSRPAAERSSLKNLPPLTIFLAIPDWTDRRAEQGLFKWGTEIVIDTERQI